MIIAIFSQNWGVILRVIYYTPSYTPQYIGIAIDEMDSMRHKKGLIPLESSLSLLHLCAFLCNLAVREGFEPSIRVNVYTLSRRAPSATRTPHQGVR